MNKHDQYRRPNDPRAQALVDYFARHPEIDVPTMSAEQFDEIMLGAPTTRADMDRIVRRLSEAHRSNQIADLKKFIDRIPMGMGAFVPREVDPAHPNRLARRTTEALRRRHR